MVSVVNLTDVRITQEMGILEGFYIEYHLIEVRRPILNAHATYSKSMGLSSELNKKTKQNTCKYSAPLLPNGRSNRSTCLKVLQP